MNSPEMQPSQSTKAPSSEELAQFIAAATETPAVSAIPPTGPTELSSAQLAAIFGPGKSTITDSLTDQFRKIFG